VELSNYYLFSHRTGSGRVTKIVTTIFQWKIVHRSTF
jgi:hypothetical protein